YDVGGWVIEKTLLKATDSKYHILSSEELMHSALHVAEKIGYRMRGTTEFRAELKDALAQTSAPGALFQDLNRLSQLEADALEKERPDFLGKVRESAKRTLIVI